MDDENARDDSTSNVRPLRPRGASPPGLPPLPGGAPPPPSAPPPEPAGDGADGLPARSRRSAADALAALQPAPPPLPAVPGQAPPGQSDQAGDDGEEPGLGTLATSAVLATTLAAARGIATVVEDARQRRAERAEEEAPLREARRKRQLAAEETAARHAVAMQGIANQAAQQRSRASAAAAGQDHRRAPQRPAGGAPGRSGMTAPGASRSPKTPSPAAPGSSRTPGSRSSNGAGPATKPSSASGGTGGKAPGTGGSPGGKTPTGGRGGRAGGRSSVGGTGDPAALERARSRSARRAARDQRAARRQEAKLDRRQGKTSAAKDSGKSGTGRTTLPQAIAEESDRRLTDRRSNIKPALDKDRDKRKDDGAGKRGADGSGPKVDLRKPRDKASGAGDGRPPKVDLSKPGDKAAGASATGGKPAGGKTGTPGPKVDLSKGKKSAGGKTSGAKASPGTDGKDGKGAKDADSDSAGAGKKSAASTPGQGREDTKQPRGEETTGGPNWDFWRPPPRGERRSAEEAMNAATDEGTVITVERADNVGDQAPPPWGPAAVTTGARGLPAAPSTPASTTAAAPGSTTSTSTREAHVSAATSTPAVVNPLAAGMSAEHATEVTVDDVLKFLEEVTKESFDAHDECVVLARKARDLRYALEDLGAVLAAKHNIIGTLTSAAMHTLADSMEVLARKADEMQVESLTAAESAETANTAMADAYKPVQQATADAGLRTPSARVHNED